MHMRSGTSGGLLLLFLTTAHTQHRLLQALDLPPTATHWFAGRMLCSHMGPHQPESPELGLTAHEMSYRLTSATPLQCSALGSMALAAQKRLRRPPRSCARPAHLWHTGLELPLELPLLALAWRTSQTLRTTPGQGSAQTLNPNSPTPNKPCIAAREHGLHPLYVCRHCDAALDLELSAFRVSAMSCVMRPHPHIVASCMLRCIAVAFKSKPAALSARSMPEHRQGTHPHNVASAHRQGTCLHTPTQTAQAACIPRVTRSTHCPKLVLCGAGTCLHSTTNAHTALAAAHPGTTRSGLYP